VSSAAQVLAANGVLRAPEVVELAAAAGLDLAAAATLLQKESGGGRNVWGSDAVTTAGTYVKGAAVTQAAYLAYRTAVRAGRAGRQGCGPTQLTYGPYQDQADALGGCWDWRSNIRVGFSILAKGIRASGLRTGFRAFNGSGAAAERYADDALSKYAIWRSRLSGATPGGDDVTEEEHGMLVAIYSQLSGSAKLGEWSGWPTWAGGTNEKLTMVDLLRRGNVETRQAWLAIQQMQKDIATLKAKYGA
jgi:hypothetical protein